MEHLLHGPTLFLNHVWNGHGIEVTHPIVVRQARLGTQPHAIADRHAISYARHGGATTQVSGYHPERRPFYKRLPLIHVKLSCPLSDIFPAKEFRRTLSYEFVTGPVKPPPAHPRLKPTLRHSIAFGSFRNPLVEGGLEQPHQRRVRHALGEKPNPRQVGRIMGRGNLVPCFHILENLFRKSDAPCDRLSQDRLKANGRKF